MNPKNTKKKSSIHENADANITCDFGDGDFSRLGVVNHHVHIHTQSHPNIVVTPADQSQGSARAAREPRPQVLSACVPGVYKVAVAEKL